MTHTENDRPPEAGGGLREGVRLFRLLHPESSQWDDLKIIEECLMTHTEDDLPPEAGGGLREMVRLVRLEHPESSQWDDIKIIEEMMLHIWTEEKRIVSKVRKAIRFLLTVLPIRWRRIGGGR
jgi:hypothetical protein